MEQTMSKCLLVSPKRLDLSSSAGLINLLTNAMPDGFSVVFGVIAGIYTIIVTNLFPTGQNKLFVDMMRVVKKI